MPRRNNRPRPKHRRYVTENETDEQPTLDQLARDLVRSGRAPQVILGPMVRPWTSSGTER